MDMHEALIAREERSGIRCRVARNAKDIRLRPISARRSLEKTDIRRNSLIILLLIISITIANGESLWSPEFGGYLSDGTTVSVGDVVTVEIDTDFVFSYSASSKDTKGTSLEYAGGEFGDLLSFLPAIKTGSDYTTKGEDAYTLSTDIVARVVELDANGGALIEGSKTLSFEGKQESMTLSGWVAQQDLGRDRKVSFSKIADSRIVFRGLLQPSEDILTAEDIEEIIPEASVEAESPTAGLETAAETGIEIQPASQALPQQKTYRLSDEKKRELFLRYVNRLIDLIFR